MHTEAELIEWINAYRRDIDGLNRQLDEVKNLPFRLRDIQRGLVLFRTSNNAHGSINFDALTFKIMDMQEDERSELASLMRSYADSIDPYHKNKR
jgi:hypothetical protein